MIGDIMQRPLLTIFIPTMNRAKNLDFLLGKLELNLRCVENTNLVEILVMDNYSKDDTKGICDKWSKKITNFRYLLQPSRTVCGEESLINGLSYLNGVYTWFIGDDDFPKKNKTLKKILENINKESFDFYALKACYVNTGKEKRTVDYIHTSCGNIRFEKAKSYFFNFGFCQMTACFSMWIVKTKMISDNAALCKEAYMLSPQYSLNFVIAALFWERPCFLIYDLSICINHNEVAGELKNFEEVAKKINRPKYYSWTLGLSKLITFLSKHTGDSIKSIVASREPVLNRATFKKVYNVSLAEFIFSFYAKEIRERGVSCFNGSFGEDFIKKMPARERFMFLACKTMLWRRMNYSKYGSYLLRYVTKITSLSVYNVLIKKYNPSRNYYITVDGEKYPIVDK